MLFQWVDQQWGVYFIGMLSGIILSALMFRWKT